MKRKRDEKTDPPEEGTGIGHGEEITSQRFLGGIYEGDAEERAEHASLPELPGVEPLHNIDDPEPYAAHDDLDQIDTSGMEPSGAARVRAAQGLINGAARLNKLRSDLRRRAEERHHGPQGEARTEEIARPVELIPLDKVFADPSFTNVRLPFKKLNDDGSDPDELLMESIRHEGLKVPIIVIAAPGVSDEEEIVYFVRAGFRRTAAIRKLGWKRIAATVLPSDTPTVDEYWVNILENSARARLSTYEIATSAKIMRDKFGIKAGEFGARAGYSETHVSNLLRCIDNLPEPVLYQWRTGAGIPLDMYRIWSTMSPAEATSQMNLWIGRHPRVAGSGSRSSSPKEKIKNSRLTMATNSGLSKMGSLRFAIETDRKLTDENRQLCLRIVDYCMGGRDDVPGLYDPSKQDPRKKPYRDRRKRQLETPEIDMSEDGPDELPVPSPPKTPPRQKLLPRKK